VPLECACRPRQTLNYAVVLHGSAQSYAPGGEIHMEDAANSDAMPIRRQRFLKYRRRMPI
jgi:hypothetical protein